MNPRHVAHVMEAYPRIFLACHTRHTRDPRTRKVLSAHQVGILDHLDERESMRLTDLARHLGVTPSTMSLTIGRLERDGYVRRQRDPKDGRAVKIRLSSAGARIRDAQEVLDRKLVARMLSKIPPEQLRRGLEGLSVLARAAHELLKERSESRSWKRRSV